MSEEERDLGVIMHRSAKPSRQCVEASKKANSTLGIISRAHNFPRPVEFRAEPQEFGFLPRN